MKSIANQYRDLREGKMSQSNFMRNLRMSFPQYVTNVTSFDDAVRILKNKSILTENINLNDEDDELEAMIKKMEQEKEGEEAIMSQFDPLEEGKKKKKKEAKAELHPNQIHPQELRMGIKVELEHTDDLDKAKKIALDHLAENPFYYTQLKLSGVDVKATPSKEKKAIAKKKDETELVDKANQMQKVKMPKAEEKKKLKEARFNIDGEPNTAAKQAMQFVDGNATLKALSDDIEIQQAGDEALLRYGYWEALPAEAVEKLKLQFNVEADGDFDEDTGELTFYRLTPIRRNYGNKDLGASFEKFKSSLEETIREVLAEMQSDEQETDEIATEID